jgi:hypothetical protein
MNDWLPGMNPEAEMPPTKMVTLWGEQVNVFNQAHKALSGGLVCRIATLPQCGIVKIMRALIAMMGKSEKPVFFYQCMLEEKIDLELLSLLKSQYSGKWSQKLNIARSECLDLLVTRALSKKTAGMVIHRADLASDELIEFILRIRNRVKDQGHSFGLIFCEQVSDEYADCWQSRIPDTIAQASFALSGLNVSGSLGYMGQVFPEARPFIEGFKKGKEKYMEAAHELYAYTRGRTDVMDNLIHAVKVFYPGKEVTLEVLSGARAFLAQPALLLLPHGIEADRE